jgi:hypothetical protein
MGKSHKAVLDRENAVEAAKHFKDSLDLLNDLLDYGTYLVPRAFVSSPRDLKAICIIFFQFRQFLVHLDGVATLATAGNCATATLQLRSLLETAHTLEWLLTSDTSAKINHLCVANLRKRRRANSMLVPGSPEAARDPGAAGRTTLTPDQLREITDEITKIDTRLASPPFNTINAKFESTYAKRGYDSPWYEVYARPAKHKLSLRTISDEINRAEEYTHIYSPFSNVSHGSDIWKSIAVGDQGVQMNPIREPQSVPQVVQLAATFALRVLRIVIMQYRAGEEESFDRKYVKDWRTRFFKKYNVNVLPRDLEI